MLIRLMGPVTAELDGNAHRFGAPKLACVLATLAMAPGEPVNSSTLITNVWGDEPPESALNVIYSYIARLRALFRTTDEVRIERSGPAGYVLATAPDNIDVHLMRNLADQAGGLAGIGDLRGALPLWRRACELSGADGLVGVGGDWAAKCRDRIRGERMRVLADRFDCELELGHHAAMVDLIAEAVAREPLAEPLVCRLMLALYRCGRAAEALERFETTRIALRDRLGADPSPALRDIHRRILQQDPELIVAAGEPETAVKSTSLNPVPAQLPPTTAGFVGRNDEITRIKARVGNHHLVVIDGMAGVGKTALAVHVAHQLAPEYPDGQLYVDLRGYAVGVDPLRPDQASAQLLRSLDHEVPQDPVERSAALRTALSGRRMLLVLDNAIDATQVKPLLPGGHDCLTIVTSRRRLVGMVDARPISLETLPPHEAADVFVTEAEIDPAEDTVDRITQACGRLPLALRVAASRLRNRPTWTPADLLQRLTNPPTALRELDAAGQGVVAAFDLSYHELDATARRLFRLLSLFPGPAFDHRTAAALADIHPDQADALLESLLDDHLVIADDVDRYRLHDLIKKYADSLIVDRSERQAAWRRLTERYIVSAWHALRHISPHSVRWGRQVELKIDDHDDVAVSAQDAEAWFQSELTTIEQMAHHTAALGLDAHTVDLCIPVQGFLLRHGATTTGRLALAELALKAASRLNDPAAQARLNNYIGTYYNDVGRADDAVAQFQYAADLWRRTGDQAGVIATLNNTASTAAGMGDYRRATELLAQAIEIAHASGLVLQEVHTRISTAEPLRQLGRLDETQAQLDAAEALLTDTELERQLPRLWFHQAVLLLRRGELERAGELAARVVSYAREGRIPDMLTSGLWAATAVDLEAGRFTAALATAQEALELLQRSRLSMAARALIHVGMAQAGMGDHSEAIESLRAAITMAEDMGARAVTAKAQGLLAEQLAVTGDTEEAILLLRSAERFYASNELPELPEVRRRLMELSS